MTNHPNRLRRTRRGAVIAAAAVLLLSGCGDDGGDDTTSPPGLDDLVGGNGDVGGDDPNDAGHGDTGDDGSVELEIVPPSFHLPATADVPSDFEVLPAACDAPDGDGTWITYAVPEDWDNTSRSGGGSGSPLSTSTELGFVRPDAGDVSVDLEPESRMPDGTILDASGEEWESFDYEITTYSGDGETTTEVTFESRGTVTVGEQDVEIWVADQSQAPDELGSTEAKARVEVADLPNPAAGDEDKLRPASFVVTISWDAEDGDIDDATIGSIIESLTLPDCTRERIVALEEVQLGEDLDGDGEVSTAQDLFG
ncbi:hypothetical protein [Actinomarinicola tropica]|uniref:Uncharacterized protein n=1 Tax=Actinomarinicola tropica TaxID=2789776 RepID=A0A5Q2RPB9_9ACTN|nr:hypothetical protein [Actinomarinicola tropica]QGG96792.1 hypothetical protein GH723_17750 [Actinomarinicola tropica]